MESGTATLTGFSGPLAHRTGTVRFTAAEFGCRTSDPTIHSGMLAGSATVKADCTPGATFGGTDTGQYTITWNNGRHTMISYVEHLGLPSHPLGHSVGKVVRGEFSGIATWDYDLDMTDPTFCISDQSIVGVWDGFTGIGAPDPGTEP